MGVVMARAVVGFVIVRERPGGTTAYLAIVSNASNLVRSALYQTQTLVGDACMVSPYLYIYSPSAKSHIRRYTGVSSSGNAGQGSLRSLRFFGPLVQVCMHAKCSNVYVVYWAAQSAVTVSSSHSAKSRTHAMYTHSARGLMPSSQHL